MSNENIVTNSIILNQMIPASDLKREDFFNNHQRLNFSDLLNGFNRHSENTDYFIHREGITFRDHVGRQLMTGNELLYYPELAKKLREVNDYPIFKRSYKIDKTIEGLGFLKYFYQYSEEHLKIFQVELEQLSNQVNHLTYLYGQDRYMPLVDNVELVKTPKCDGTYAIDSQALIIHGVKWPVSKRRWENPKNCNKETEYLDLRRFLTISPELEYLFLEDFVVGTPFIQVRLVKTWQHKGHTQWYSLDTRQQVSKADVVRWKKPA